MPLPMILVPRPRNALLRRNPGLRGYARIRGAVLRWFNIWFRPENAILCQAI